MALVANAVAFFKPETKRLVKSKYFLGFSFIFSLK